MKTYPTTMTTGQTAKLLNCSQQSIIRAFDTGIIKGHKIPGSKFRRIHTQDLLTYMKENNIPIPEEQTKQTTTPNP